MRSQKERREWEERVRLKFLDGQRCSEIAAAENCAYGTVQRVTRALRRELRAKLDAEVAELRRAGVTIPEIAERLGVTLTRARNSVYRAGLKRSRPGRPSLW